MTDTLIYLFIISSLLQIVSSVFIFKRLINPILYFNILFFLHNWSYSFGSFIYPDALIPWRADPYVSYETQSDVLLINLISLWVLFLTFITFTLRRQKVDEKNYTNFRHLSLFPFAYFFLTFCLLLKLYLDGALSGFFVYGQGQASTSIEAFSPLLQILGLRVIFASAYLILNKNKNSYIISLIFFTEIIFTLLEGGRKVLFMLVLSALIPLIEHTKIYVIRFLQVSFGAFLIVYLLIFTTFFRAADRDSSFLERVNESNMQLIENAELITFLAINLANSEGVQNWTYQLIEDEEIDISYGKSYAQAMVNVVVLRPFQGDIADWQAAYVFKQAAYPEQNNHGYDFSFTAESILNWGPNFSFISYVLLGLMSSFLYNRRLKNDFYKLLYFSLWPILFISFRTDATALLRTLSLYLFVSFLALIDVKSLKLRYKKTHN